MAVAAVHAAIFSRWRNCGLPSWLPPIASAYCINRNNQFRKQAPARYAAASAAQRLDRFHPSLIEVGK